MGFVSIFGLLLLQSCQNRAIEERAVGKVKLEEAASYNAQLGLAYLKQEDRARAKQKLLLALSEAPNAPFANAAMAYFYETTGEFDRARVYYRNALAIAPKRGAPLNNYGAFLCRQGHYRQAERYFLMAANDREYVHTALAYENAGLCALGIPDNRKAATYFQKALKQDPSRKPSLYELVEITIKQGQPMEALTYLQTYSFLTLHDRSLLALAENVAIKAGKPKLADEYRLCLQRITDKTGVKV